MVPVIALTVSSTAMVSGSIAALINSLVVIYCASNSSSTILLLIGCPFSNSKIGSPLSPCHKS